MSMLHILATYLISVSVFVAIDGIWLGFVARTFYQTHIGHVLGPVNWTAAVVFYLLFLVGLMVFVILPGIEQQSLIHTLTFGALFGFFMYATYDLTNLATLKDWSLTVAVVDMVWGSILSASVAALTYVIAVRFLL